MSYPIKTLSELPLLLLGLRKSQKLTQADLARQLGISQQSYAKLEANPAVASMARLFRVLQLLGAEFVIETTSPAQTPPIQPGLEVARLGNKSGQLSDQITQDAIAHFKKDPW